MWFGSCTDEMSRMASAGSWVRDEDIRRTRDRILGRAFILGAYSRSPLLGGSIPSNTDSATTDTSKILPLVHPCYHERACSRWRRTGTYDKQRESLDPSPIPDR